MRPQDLVILLKTMTKDSYDWMMKGLAYELGNSNREVSESHGEIS